MREIQKYPIDQQKQKLVSRLFEVRPENCNWKTVNAAIGELKVIEWEVRRPSMINSSSVDTGSCLSSISTAGIIIVNNIVP